MKGDGGLVQETEGGGQIFKKTAGKMRRSN